MAIAKKHKGHYCKICGEYKSKESFSGKGHAQHICKECMGEIKKGNKMILDLPFEDDEFEIVGSCEDFLEGKLAVLDWQKNAMDVW